MCSMPIKFAIKSEPNSTHNQSPFPPHCCSQLCEMSGVPCSSGAPRVANLTHFLSLNMSVRVADITPVHQMVNRSQSSDGSPLRTCHNTFQPLSHSADAWRELPGVSEWVIKTVTNGYTIQFARRPPRFSGVIMSDVPDGDATVLRAEVRSLLSKQAIEVVPAESMKSGLYSRYFLVPKKRWGSSSYSGFETAEPCVSKALIQNDNCATFSRTFSPGTGLYQWI